MATSHYYDPTTDMLTMYRDYLQINTSGASLESTLGIRDFPDLTDVKIKILSIEYKSRIFTSNITLADNNVNAFNEDQRMSAGNVVFGVKNLNDTQVYNSLDDFQGSSAWPTYITAWSSQVGLPASVSKMWKPPKLALSDEQVAFVCVRNNSGISSSVASTTWGSICIRAIRL